MPILQPLESLRVRGKGNDTKGPGWFDRTKRVNELKVNRLEARCVKAAGAGLFLI